MKSVHLSGAELDEKLLDGLGRGCDPVINTLSERYVWLQPRPLAGGHTDNLARHARGAARSSGIKVEGSEVRNAIHQQNGRNT